MKGLLLATLLLVTACAAQHTPHPVQSAIIQASGTTIATRINPPDGYHRLPAAAGSYADYLRKLALYPDGTPVHYYDGREKPNPDIYAAVLRLDRGTEDLQQCADAVMRMRAEWLYASGRRRDIHFALTNGFVLDYAHWMAGYRLSLRGAHTAWVKAGVAADTYASFRKYLDVVYAYAGTRSLAKELQPVPFTHMQTGDVLIMGGAPGHAVTVMDMAQNSAGERLYLLSQSYMPAQDIQILCNPADASISPWYMLSASPGTVHTPQWDFTTSDLKRFAPLPDAAP